MDYGYGLRLLITSSFFDVVLILLGCYQLDNNEDNADLIVLNTCHIREKAVEKTYSELGRIRDKIKLRKEKTGKKPITNVNLVRI